MSYLTDCIDELHEILKEYDLAVYTGFLKEMKIIVTFKSDKTMFNKEFVFNNLGYYKRFKKELRRLENGAN